jgi:hypothetical protein
MMHEEHNHVEQGDTRQCELLREPYCEPCSSLPKGFYPMPTMGALRWSAPMDPANGALKLKIPPSEATCR